jgi:hypothetical protein
MSKWLSASCSTCGGEFHYHIDWERIPDLCKDCIAEKKAASAKWREMQCSCGNTIRYHEDWERIPDLCKDCIAVKKAERAKWLEKDCPCGGTIRYHQDWNNIPAYCKECNAWLSKPCAAQSCSEEIRYKKFWDRIPEYCRPCKNGERDITVRQQDPDGNIHEYAGKGYVNRQGVAIFKDDGPSGKHSHTVLNADGTPRGHRDEGFGENWVNDFVRIETKKTTVSRDDYSSKHHRFKVPYKDRGSNDHVHDFARYDGWLGDPPSEGTANEDSPRTGRKK